MLTSDILTSGTDRDVLSVSQLNRRAKQLLETHLPLLWVEGELSNVSQPSSGHWYFTLKDEQAQIRCAMFRNRNMLVRFSPQQGQQVLLRARVSLYEGRGDYQLIVEHMEEAGFGALQRAFDALKTKLSAEGLFDEAHKQPLPPLPNHIAVITSPSGAAIHDVLSVLKRRFPAIPVTVIPVAVQGKEAAPQIVRAIDLANRAGLFDVVLLTRGGGSLEDLWSFNEESVARAVFASRLPIVCAVGHEVDFTIAEFVADLRAPTPSAAAELLVPDGEDWLETFAGYEILLEQAIERKLRLLKQRLEWLRTRLRHPGERLQQQAQRLDGLEMRLVRAVDHQLLRYHTRLNTLVLRQKPLQPHLRVQQLSRQLTQYREALLKNMQRHLRTQQQRLAEAARLLHTVSPLNTLQRGYAIATDDHQKVITASSQVAPGDRINTRLAEGELQCRVEKILS